MKNKVIYVKCNDELVGTLAFTKDKKVAFQYSEHWIKNGFSISPISLPLINKVFIPTKPYFDGLFGVFSDSLPDAWGKLLLDKILRKYKVNRDEFNALNKLSMIGKNGMGILTYEPSEEMIFETQKLSLDELKIESGKVLKSIETENIDELFKLGGSSGGARPKVLIEDEGRNWIVKFPSSYDQDTIGVMEYDYFECARECGINVPQTHLFSSILTPGYFGIERFDICNGKRVHMITVAGLLELDYRAPTLDYIELIRLTKYMTNDKDSYEMFRRMCFNIFSHNQDDHAKNFSFLYNVEEKCWRLSPAYDLTYSNTYFGEQTTSVNGKGNKILDEDLLECGIKNGLEKQKCLKIINDIKDVVNHRLKKYTKQ